MLDNSCQKWSFGFKIILTIIKMVLTETISVFNNRTMLSMYFSIAVFLWKCMKKMTTFYQIKNIQLKHNAAKHAMIH